MPNVAALVDIWGCKALNLPLTYLGLPLGATLKKKKKTVWNFVVEEMENTLLVWKACIFPRVVELC